MLATIVQLSSDKVHPVNRWKNLDAGYPRDLQIDFIFLSEPVWDRAATLEFVAYRKRNSGQVSNLTAKIACETALPRLYRAAAEPATCKIICVPLSNFTLRPAELITEP